MLITATAQASGRSVAPEEVAKRIEKNLVEVLVDSPRDGAQVFSGSGVILHQEQVITNWHVGDGAHRRWWVRFDGGVYEAKPILGDEDRDMVVFSVPGLPGTPVRGVRRFDSLQVGETVYSYGNPDGWTKTFAPGIISALRRGGECSKQVLGGTCDWVQTTAPISPGSSGGGLFDGAGKLIGLTTLAHFQSQDGRPNQAINMAISVDHAADLEARTAQRNRLSEDTVEAPHPTTGIGVGDCIEVTKKVLTANPNDPDAWKYAGWCAEQQGRPDIAVQAFRRAVELAPNDAGAWESLGNDLTWQQPGQASSGACYAYEQAFAINRSSDALMTDVGWCRVGEGRNDHALKLFNVAVSLNRDNGLAWFGIGRVYVNQNNAAAALEPLTEATRLLPGYGWPWFDLAKTHYALGDAQAFRRDRAVLRKVDVDAWNKLNAEVSKVEQAQRRIAEEGSEQRQRFPTYEPLPQKRTDSPADDAWGCLRAIGVSLVIMGVPLGLIVTVVGGCCALGCVASLASSNR